MDLNQFQKLKNKDKKAIKTLIYILDILEKVGEKEDSSVEELLLYIRTFKSLLEKEQSSNKILSRNGVD